MAQYHYGLTSNLSKAEFIRRKLFLERLIAKLEARLEKAPEGSLVINRKARTNSPGFYHVVPGKKKRMYLSETNRETIALLAQKEYDRKALRVIRKEVAAIEQVLAYCDLKKAEEFLAEARRLFQKRVDDGDGFTDNVLQQATKEWLEVTRELES